ncbi:hypothetical protein FOA43_002613 [Brettanomyces nanus]|uniref:Kinesin-like protein n=1 Tax=Eeniella nana TaxID=13502 RepID=A0A875S2X7_EENNA|nr:uncharacterized protein FOA43_002613 [Brettanomyces nanus]QPG75263.1 hypothetical protein FOA43_002613 [Brettanomyces nanus]
MALSNNNGKLGRNDIGSSSAYKRRKLSPRTESLMKTDLNRAIEYRNKSKQLLTVLQEEVWQIRSQLAENEVALDRLEGEYDGLRELFDVKECELNEMDLKGESIVKHLEECFVKFKTVQEKEFNENVEKMGQEYDKKAANMVALSQKQFEEEEKRLKDRSEELKVEMNKVEEDFALEVAVLKKNHRLREINLKLEREREIQELKRRVRETDDTILVQDGDIREILRKIKEEREKNSVLCEEHSKLDAKAEEYETKTARIRSETDGLVEQLETFRKQKTELEKKCDGYNSEADNYNRKSLEEEALRRKLHERLQSLKGNIRVFCRIRPEQNPMCFPMEYCDDGDGKEESEVGEDLIKIQEPAGFGDRRKSGVTCSPRSYSFKFDKVFGSQDRNEDIFEEISQLVQSALDGYNVCIFAYGQTGSGKTFTMSSPGDGMIPRSVNQIFRSIEETKKSGWSYKITGQFLEIYRETINDLITGNGGIEIKHSQTNRKTVLTNVSKIELRTPSQVDRILQKVNESRSTASTKINDRSSRSHFIFILSIIGSNSKTGENVEGTLNLVDLAGSERVSRSQVTGTRLRETMFINRSLSSLGDVIISLKNKNQHIPYRNSKLTYLLQYSLGGNSKTLMFVNISPSVGHFNETLNSLRFAHKVNGTHIGRATK